MKTFLVLAVSIVLVGILFCPMAMSAPSMPDDLQIVQPDPSLPKELLGFFGKWEGTSGLFQYFLIVEKIDQEKSSVYVWAPGFETSVSSWERYEAQVIKEGRKYKLWYRGRQGSVEMTLKGEYLDFAGKRLTRVP